MKQQTLAMAKGLSTTRRRRDGRCLWRRWGKWCRGRSCVRWSNQCMPRRGRGGLRWGRSGYCGFTFCSSGSTCPTPGWKKRCTIRRGCGSLWASIWGGNRCRTRPRCASSAICWRSTSWGERLLERVGEHLQAKGLRLSPGTIVDATIINAPSSNKNARQERDPEMHQTRKGKQWYFGMKAHVGVDSQTKLIHSVVATAANAADSTMLLHLLHAEETRVWGDPAYRWAKRGAARTRAARPGLYPPALSLQGSHRRGGTGEEPDQVQSAIQGGTRLCRTQTQVWVRQGALSRTGQECEPPVCDLRAGEFVPGAQATVVRYGGVVPHEAAEPPSPGGQSKRHASWGEPNHRLPRSLLFASL